jgi:hypothetical protein
MGMKLNQVGAVGRIDKNAPLTPCWCGAGWSWFSSQFLATAHPSSFILSEETFPGIARNYWAKTVDPADSLTK